MINFAYFAKIQNTSNKEQKSPKTSRPSDQTVHLVQEILNNSLTPVLLIKDPAGQTLRREAPRTLDLFPATEMQSLIQLAHFLITERMDVRETAAIYSALANMLPNERVLMVEYALSLTTANMDGREKAQVIQRIQETPENLRATLVHHAKFLLTSSMNGDDVGNILDAVRKLSPEDRKNIVSLANSLINRHMIGTEVLSIFTNIKDLPPEKRDSIVKLANCIITRQMDQSAISTILNHLKTLYKDKCLVEEARCLFTEQMDPQTKMEILTAIADVPPNDRKSIIELTIKLIPSDMIPIKHRVEAIQVLNAIPKQQRKNAVIFACGSQDAVSRIKFVHALHTD